MIGRATNDRWRGRRIVHAAALTIIAFVGAAASSAYAEPESLKIVYRAGPDSGLLLFEFRRRLDYTVERDGAYTIIRFARPVSGEFGPARIALSRYIDELRLIGDGHVLLLLATGPPHMDLSRFGNAIVVTWIGPGRPEAPIAERAREGPAPRAEAPQAEHPPSEAEPGAGKQSAAPVSPTPALTAPEAPPAEAQRPEFDLGKPKSAAEPRDPVPAPPPAGPTLRVTSAGAETRVAVAWPEPVGAAVFQSGEMVWIVFPRRHTFDLGASPGAPGPGVETVRQIEHPDATILVARLRAGADVLASREGDEWIITFRPSGSRAEEDDLKMTVARGHDEHVAIALPGSGTPIRVANSESGSTFYVVPAMEAAAVAGDRRFVTFRLIPAAQGAVIQALADGLEVSAADDTIVVRREGGLLLSEEGAGPSGGR